MNDLVSIIVPIYNVEKYIESGIKSLINQTYKNIEIILVDDGSLDNSSNICDEYAKKDKRIKVVHKENGGVSSARNAGIKKACGKYITFVDGDDYVDSDYVEYLVKVINDTKSNIGINLLYYSINNNIKEEKKITKVLSENVIEGIYVGKVDVAVWNKIYNKEFLNNNNIEFDEKIWYGEGMLFNIQCLQYTNDVGVGCKKVYHQVYNINSAMRKFSMESNLCGLRSLELQKSSWKKINKNIINAWNFHKYCFNFSIVRGLIKSNQVNDYYKEYKQCIKNLKKKHFIAFKINSSLKKKIKYFIISLAPVLMAKSSIKREYKKAINNR